MAGSHNKVTLCCTQEMMLLASGIVYMNSGFLGHPIVNSLALLLIVFRAPMMPTLHRRPLVVFDVQCLHQLAIICVRLNLSLALCRFTAVTFPG